MIKDHVTALETNFSYGVVQCSTNKSGFCVNVQTNTIKKDHKGVKNSGFSKLNRKQIFGLERLYFIHGSTYPARSEVPSVVH